MEIENSIPPYWRESTISILKRQNKFLLGNVFLSEPLSTPRDSSHCKKLCKSVSGFRHKSLTGEGFPSPVRQYQKYPSGDSRLLSPDLLRDLFHESKLVPLLFLCELIPDLAGRESALRAEAQPLQRHESRCIVNPFFQDLLVLKLRPLRRDKSEHYLLSLRNPGEAVKASGSLICLLYTSPSPRDCS